MYRRGKSVDLSAVLANQTTILGDLTSISASIGTVLTDVGYIPSNLSASISTILTGVGYIPASLSANISTILTDVGYIPSTLTANITTILTDVGYIPSDLTARLTTILADILALSPLTGKPRVYPSAAASKTVIAGGSAWASGAWVVIVASTAAAGSVTAVAAKADATADSSNATFEIDIGTGTTGSEVVIATLVIQYAFKAEAGWLTWPILPVSPPQTYGSAVQLNARIRCSAALYKLVLALQCVE